MPDVVSTRPKSIWGVKPRRPLHPCGGLTKRKTSCKIRLMHAGHCKWHRNK